jgi:hypothetical protein
MLLVFPIAVLATRTVSFSIDGIGPGIFYMDPGHVWYNHVM